MHNRLLRLQLLRLLLLVGCIIPCTLKVSAQCECPNPGNSCSGDVFTMTNTVPDTVVVGVNCKGVFNLNTGSVTFNPVPFGFPQTYTEPPGYSNGDSVEAGTTVMVHYIVTNGSVSDTLCFNIAFVDKTPPVINYLLSNDTADCATADFGGWLQAHVDSLMATSTDNCGIDTVTHNAPATFPGSCSTVTVIFTVWDEEGNATFASASYTMEDDDGPNFFIGGNPAANSTFQLNCNDPVPPVPTVTASDDCGSGSIAVSLFETTSFNPNLESCNHYTYTIVRRWVATDSCGNSDTLRHILNFEDLLEPDFTAPGNLVLVCGSNTSTNVTGNVTSATDNCDLTPALSFIENTTPGVCPQEKIIMRTWTATDACGNFRSRSQTITVIDTVPPTANFPADITIDCDDVLNINLTGQPSNLADNCDTLVQDSLWADLVLSGACPNTYTIQRTWRIEDACGNSVDSVQIITVTDLKAPVVTQASSPTYPCGTSLGVDSLFYAWVANHGSATASDNCSGTANLSWAAYNTGTNTPATLGAPTCPSAVPGAFRRQTVDFIVTDECGNRDTTTATFTVADNEKPQVSNCPSDRNLATDPGDCSSTPTLELPFVTEDCGNVTVPFSFSQTQPFTVPPGTTNFVETPVNDVVFNFHVQGPPYSTQGNVTLVVALNNADGEAPTEFFNIYAENGILLGSTTGTGLQCGNSSTAFVLSAALFDGWAADGLVKITLKPNIPPALPGRFSVNSICPNNAATVSLNYQANLPVDLRLEYSVDGGARQQTPFQSFPSTFDAGSHSVRYFITDCAGNTDSTCVFTVEVADEEAPQIACPPSASLNLATGSCDQDVEIPLFAGVTDNCGVTPATVQTQPSTQSESYLTFSYNPNLNDYVADDKTFTFSGLQGNATPGNVQLVIEIRGDVDSTGEYFEIYDNDGNLLGTTAKGQAHVTPGNCSTPSTASFSIDANTFNGWASAGDIGIVAKSYQDYPIPPAGPGWGINPCNPGAVTADGDTDSTYITATFIYESISPVFSASGATPMSAVTLTPPLSPAVFTLNQGTTTFTYQVTDLAGNKGECSFDVNIVDNEPPVAICAPTFVSINPSGFVFDTIFPQEIDLGSTDNCTISSIEVFPNVISCNYAGSNVLVTLSVTDEQGNVGTCDTYIAVTAETPAPSAVNNCGSVNLNFFANPPASPSGGSSFQYVWYNPQGNPFAFVENPVIQDADNADEGFYVVAIQGVTGCQAVGTVQVTCEMLPLRKPVAQTAASMICASENIQLITDAVCGSVTYKWYTGTAPSGVLMGTTSTPTYTMLPPASGMYTFYVVVERNGCESAASDAIQVQVNAAPTATPAQASFILCHGEDLLLNSINNLPGTTCHWTGPCGFESFNCSPSLIPDVTACNAGLYQLVTSRNGCESTPAFVAVNVINAMPTPQLTNTTSAQTPVCEGNSFTLTATAVQGAVSYLWTTPQFTTVSTPNPMLNIASADLGKDAGLWTVRAIGNPCESETSAPTTVYIAPKPQGVTAAANPVDVCEGQDVQLSSSSASPNVSYLWIYPNTQTNALQNPVLEDVSSADDGAYTLTVTNQFGCAVQKVVAVNVLDRVDITGASSDAPTCATGPVDVHLVATLFPQNPGNYQFLWTGPNGYTSTNASATIPNATIANSGPYTLVVTNSLGCSSLPYTVDVAVPDVLPTPGVPVMSGFNPFCEGDNLTLTTTPFPSGNAQYQWTTPTGSYTTSNPSLPISGLTTLDEGTYSVRYLKNGCPSGQSGSLQVEVNPTPLINPTSNTPVCEGESLELSVQCTAGATYEWTGPGGFSSGVCNPVLANANPGLHSGTFSVRIKVDGCWSEVVPVNVVVNPEPEVPTAVNSGPYCASTDVVMLTVTTNSATPGASYAWYDENGVPLGAATPSLNFSLPNPAQYGEGSHEFYVVANLGACTSLPSVPTVVTLNTVPANQAAAGPDVSGCGSEDIILQATPPTVGSGWWTLVSGAPNGVSIANPDQATTTVSGLNPGDNYVFQWTLSNGACENYSQDQAGAFLSVLEQANAGESILICHGNSAELNATAPSTSIGEWTQPAAQALLGVVIENPADPATEITGLVPGNSYLFTWTIDGGCGTSSESMLVNVSNQSAFAGEDHADCGEGTINLSAANFNGVWTSPDASIQFSDPDSSKTVATNLKPGDNLFIWTIDGGACGDFSVDSLIVSYQFEPKLGNDLAQVEFAGEVDFDVTLNDTILGNFQLEIIQQPLHGSLDVGLDGQVTYKSDASFSGDDVVIYEICVDGCECATATLTIRVGEEAACVPPSIITPNGDKINDAFIVPCLSQGDRYPASQLNIYNQWGDEVYHAEPYQNDWEGTFDGEDLPAGTYFFVLDLGNGDKPMSGYLILQR